MKELLSQGRAEGGAKPQVQTSPRRRLQFSTKASCLLRWNQMVALSSEPLQEGTAPPPPPMMSHLLCATPPWRNWAESPTLSEVQAESQLLLLTSGPYKVLFRHHGLGCGTWRKSCHQHRLLSQYPPCPESHGKPPQVKGAVSDLVLTTVPAFQYSAGHWHPGPGSSV